MIMAVIIRFYELRWPAAACSDGTHSIIDIDVSKSAVALVTGRSTTKIKHLYCYTNYSHWFVFRKLNSRLHNFASIHKKLEPQIKLAFE